MSKENKYSKKDPEEFSGDFFRKAEVRYERSKDEVWASLAADTRSEPKRRRMGMTTERLMLGLAAGLILLLSIGAVMRFYSKTVRVEAGEHLTYVLPDGSKVQLNAQTMLTYNPFWWRFSREIGFEGEAFFEVNEGDKFSVRAHKGIVEVLGTSFNVYSRPDNFRVLCVTGKVRVKNKLNEEEILTPGYEATISNLSRLEVSKNTQARQSISWKDGMFHFTATPLKQVLQEIERQYNVRIVSSGIGDLSYTGYFSRENSIEDVLRAVCLPFNLNFVQKQENIYEITF